jgi:hypothetical protein
MAKDKGVEQLQGLRYVGTGQAIVDVPARNLSANDLDELFATLSPQFKAVYQTRLADAAALRAWLLTSGLYAEPDQSAPEQAAESE